MDILVLTGDGIGPEIVAATLPALAALDQRFGLGLNLEERAIGFAGLAAEGSTLPGGVAEAARGRRRRRAAARRRRAAAAAGGPGGQKRENGDNW